MTKPKIGGGLTQFYLKALQRRWCGRNGGVDNGGYNKRVVFYVKLGVQNETKLGFLFHLTKTTTTYNNKMINLRLERQNRLNLKTKTPHNKLELILRWSSI